MYNIGDFVTIRSDLTHGQWYGGMDVSPQMQEMRNRTFKIYDTCDQWYRLETSNREYLRFNWSSEMFKEE